MNTQYLSDTNGNTIGVFIPINDWIALKEKYTDIDEELINIPEWQVQEVRERLKSSKKHPEKNLDFDATMNEIDKDLN
jgi:hypothetical protein